MRPMHHHLVSRMLTALLALGAFATTSTIALPSAVAKRHKKRKKHRKKKASRGATTVAKDKKDAAKRGGTTAASGEGSKKDDTIAVDQSGYQEAAKQALSIATFHYKKGNFKEAAPMFHQAYKLQPRVEFLFNAARCEQRSMQLDAAEKHFQQCLEHKDAPPQVIRRATVHLGEIRSMKAALNKANAKAEKARAEADAAKKAAANIAAGKTASGRVKAARKPLNPWKEPAGYGAVGLGVVMLGVGGYLAATYASGQADLDAKTEQRDDAKLVVGIDWQSYETEQNDLNGTAAMRTTLLLAGTAAAAAGVWMLLTADELEDPAAPKVSLVPTSGRSVALTLQF